MRHAFFFHFFCFTGSCNQEDKDQFFHRSYFVLRPLIIANGWNLFSIDVVCVLLYGPFSCVEILTQRYAENWIDKNVFSPCNCSGKATRHEKRRDGQAVVDTPFVGKVR